MVLRLGEIGEQNGFSNRSNFEFMIRQSRWGCCWERYLGLCLGGETRDEVYS